MKTKVIILEAERTVFQAGEMMGDKSLIQPKFNSEYDLLKHLRENMELDQAIGRSER